MHVITAKRDGVCPICEFDITAGVDRITVIDGEWMHVHCANEAQDAIATLEKQHEAYETDLRGQILAWQKKYNEMRDLLLFAIDGKDESDIDALRELMNEVNDGH